MSARREQEDPVPMPKSNRRLSRGSVDVARRVTMTVLGSVLLLLGIALLVLPGPGLLLVLAGLLVLADAFPAVHRFVEPVRERALDAAEQSVSSPLRLTGSILVGLWLIGVGVVWTLFPSLPLGGWPTGVSLMFSGLILFGLLAFSLRRVKRRRAAAQDQPARR